MQNGKQKRVLRHLPFCILHSSFCIRTAGDHMNVALHQELAKVGLRYRRLLLRGTLAACFLALAAAGITVLSWARGSAHAVPGVQLVLLLLVPRVVTPLLAPAVRPVRSP